MAEPASSMAAWRRIAGDLVAGIPERWAVGAKLPSYAELQEQYDVSMSPVAEAIKYLRERGLVRGRPGLGILVARMPRPGDAPPEDPKNMTNWKADIERQLADQEERIRALEERSWE